MSISDEKDKTANKAAANRGNRAPAEGSGEVVGSGAGAGGGGNAEDFDSDPNGGGGDLPTGSGIPATEGLADHPSNDGLKKDQINPLAPPIDVTGGS